MEEGGFPELGELAGVEGEDAAGLREVCVDMAAVITQVRLLASATQVRGGAGGAGRASPARLEPGLYGRLAPILGSLLATRASCGRRA